MKRNLTSTNLFVRALLFLFAAVLAAQALTFGLALLVPAPSPHLTRLAAIAESLSAGRPVVSVLQVVVGRAPTDDFIDPYEREMASQLATRLKVGTASVRVVLMRDTGIGAPSPPGEPPRSGNLPMPPRRMPSNEAFEPDNVLEPNDILVGRFEAAVRLPDGRWRTATPIISRVDRWQWEVLAGLLGVLLVVTPFAFFLARRLARPITAFMEAVERMGKDPTGAAIPVTGPPEIAAAAAAFNDMQTRLKRYVDDRTTMVGAIAHDLRTPLMRLSLRLQSAPDDLRTASEADIREIEEMATAALSFVRDLSHQDNRHRVALRSIVETVVDEFADRDADVALEPGEDVILVADHNGLKRMISNIVGNAIMYGGTARVKLTVSTNTATIEVTDTGPGVPEAEIERVFDPFYRVELSRNKNTGGMGLGLASARAVARGHGGDIILQNITSGGLVAIVSLPR